MHKLICESGIDVEHKSNCLICGHPLEYLSSAADVTCFYCGKKEKGNIVCSKDLGHYVCDDCHNLSSYNYIKDFILTTGSKNPFKITFDILNNSSVNIPMLGCHHAYILTGAVLASLKNRGYVNISEADIEEAFYRLSKQAVGGYCGLSGVCGIVPAGGIVYSILTGSVCGRNEEQKITMKITALLSKAIFDLTGPSCCKAYLFKALEILAASLKEDFNFILIDNDVDIKCNFKELHLHGCMLERCPYYFENLKNTPSVAVSINLDKSYLEGNDNIHPAPC
ncbi:MAG: DUF5714 domain-containing protein [Deltaproteobacteria bacterium]|nr:DUF5714 domain-containing protein [Deltaproteobacteria bacterium]